MAAPRIRLIAIAKDEGAYLVDWLFHHLYFGFDHIEVWLNRSADASARILDRVSTHHAVSLEDGDQFVGRDSPLSFQKTVYQHAYLKAAQDGMDYVCFLDIDEFWTPRDFATGIHALIREYPDADGIVAPWVVPRDDSTPFSRPFRQPQHLFANQHVKSLSRTHLSYDEVGIHAIHGPEIRHVLPGVGPLHNWNGSTLDAVQRGHSAPESHTEHFVFHRMWRSPVEYVASLAQGMRQAQRHSDREQALKINRRGYGKPDAERLVAAVWEIPDPQLLRYDADHAAFVTELGLESAIVAGRSSVLQRFEQAVNLLRAGKKAQPELVQRLLDRLPEPEDLLQDPKGWLQHHFGATHPIDSATLPD